MNRAEFLKAVGALSAFAGAKLTFARNPPGAIDDVVINRTDDPAQYTVPEVRDHAVQDSYANIPLSITLNDAQGSPYDWNLIKVSDNLSDLNVMLIGSIIGSTIFPTDADVGKEYELRYQKVDPANPDTGINRIVKDEIDKYWTKFIINYTADGQPDFVSFNSPNSVTKYLMGWNPEDPINFQEIQTIAPDIQQQAFVDYFANLQELLTNPEYAMGLSRVVNRNTPVPVPDRTPSTALWPFLTASPREMCLLTTSSIRLSSLLR